MLFQGMYYHHVCLQYACAAVFVREQEIYVWEIGCSEKLAETLRWGVFWKPQEVDTSPKHPRNRPKMTFENNDCNKQMDPQRQDASAVQKSCSTSQISHSNKSFTGVQEHPLVD